MRARRFGVAPIAFVAIGIVALTGAAAAVLLPACGLQSWLGPKLIHCPVPTVPDSVLEAQKLLQADLEAEIVALERALARMPCLAEAAAVEVEPSVAEVDPSGTEVEPPPAEIEQAAADQIEEKRWKDKDLSLLADCWNLDSEFALRDSQTGEPRPVTEWKACFDEAGAGIQTITHTDGTRCEGPLHAVFDGAGTLLLQDRRDVPCIGNVSRIIAREYVCFLNQERRIDCSRDYPYAQSVGLRR